jgi:hypothetical protein
MIRYIRSSYKHGLLFGFLLTAVVLTAAHAEPQAPPDGGKWNSGCHQQGQSLDNCCEYNSQSCQHGCKDQTCAEDCVAAEKTCVAMGIATRGGATTAAPITGSKPAQKKQ